MTDKEIQLDGKAIGAYLRSKRKESDLNQQQAADLCSVSQDTYKKWEQGSRIPSLIDLVILSRFYHVSIETIIQLESPSSQEHISDPGAQNDITNNISENTASSIQEFSSQRKENLTQAGFRDSDFLFFTENQDHLTDKDEKRSIRKKRAIKPASFLVFAGLITMILILTAFIITLIHLQNMAREDYKDLIISETIESFELEPDETIYNEAQ